MLYICLCLFIEIVISISEKKKKKKKPFFGLHVHVIIILRVMLTLLVTPHQSDTITLSVTKHTRTILAPTAIISKLLFTERQIIVRHSVSLLADYDASLRFKLNWVRLVEYGI